MSSYVRCKPGAADNFSVSLLDLGLWLPFYSPFPSEQTYVLEEGGVCAHAPAVFPFVTRLCMCRFSAPNPSKLVSHQLEYDDLFVGILLIVNVCSCPHVSHC
jgi:hypothetical protein